MSRALICVFVLVTGLLPAQDLLLRGGRVIPIGSPELAEADVWIENGRIKAVGTDLDVPAAVPTVVAKGFVVMPGFVVGHTSSGMDVPNEQVPVTPYVSVLDSLDPAATYFEDCLRDGHLTILVIPGDRTVIGGMGRVVSPRGLMVEDMTVVADAGMKISMIPPSGNRASHLAKLRGALDEGVRYWKELQEKTPDKTATGNASLDLEAFQADRRKAALVRMLKREVPAFIACGTASDVDRALEIADSYKLDARLVCHPGCWRAAKTLAARKDVPVLLAGAMEQWETDPETGRDVLRVAAKEFHAAGVKFSVTHTPGALGPRYLWYQAASLVRHGLSRDEALMAVTRNAAEFAGVGARKGSIEPGKDADLLLLTADPLSGRAWVDTAYVEGMLVYDRRRDPRLTGILGGDRP